MATHVTRLLGQMGPANRYRLLGISRLPVFIGKGREIPSRIFVKFLPELVNPGGPLHQKTSGLCRPVLLSGQNGSRYRVCVTRVNQTTYSRMMQLSRHFPAFAPLLTEVLADARVGGSRLMRRACSLGRLRLPR